MNIPEEIKWIASMLIGALATYYGAMNAIREDLARLKAESAANKSDAEAAFTHAQRAHDRIDRAMHR